jgi:hypothetical protein
MRRRRPDRCREAGAARAAAPAVGDAAPAVGGTPPAVRLTRGDLIKSWALWSFFSHANYNYERLQGTGFAHAMTPIIKRLYSTEDEIRAALKRHLVFFNTEPNFGNVVHGTVIAMEEQRANGAAIDDDAINSVKSGLMGPMAGIGDTLSQSTIAPILLAIGIGIAERHCRGLGHSDALRRHRQSPRRDHLFDPHLDRDRGHRLHGLDGWLRPRPVVRDRIRSRARSIASWSAPGCWATWSWRARRDLRGRTWRPP